ncbi:MAG: hypothetical protein JSU94_17460 [Phycisphaerales bacterium]|nr:MAG: hypothetical protein JSU94_17460 [Phycisphaerales bacterium]
MMRLWRNEKMRTRNRRIHAVALYVLLSIASPALASVIFVDADATGANDGSSWADAYYYLQDALMFAVEGDEIKVAQGIYKPDDFVLSDRPSLGREETFHLINGVAIKGGYAGLGEPDPNARDIKLYETILSGDIGDEEDTCHVVTGSGTSASAALDGFVVTGGMASSACDCWFGAGMYIYAGSPTVANCTFIGNWALDYGGGICNDGNSCPLFVNCAFIGNSATDGGGVDNEYSNPTFENCLFTGNWVDEYNADSFSGGAMYNFHSSPALINCTVSGNEVRQWWCYCGGIYNRGDDSRPMLTNCILWGNIDQYDDIQQAQIAGGLPIVNYCCIEGLTGDLGGTGNVGDDPCFVDCGYRDTNGTPDDGDDDFWVDGDYHLKSQAGRWDPNEGRWVKDDVTSPCIDAGDPADPVGPESFPNGGIVNMGAYGGTAEASRSYFGKPTCETIVAGDINGDCIVDFKDFALMAGHWLEL